MNDNIAEGVRQKIKILLDEATKDFEGKYKEQTMHLMTQIAFEMYKVGWKEAFKTSRKSLEHCEQIMR